MARRSLTIFLIIVSNLLVSCVHHRALRELSNEQISTVYIPRQDMHVVYMPQMQRMPAHILVSKTTLYKFPANSGPSNFKHEVTINPLMHNASLSAQVQKNGKKVDSYEATKSEQSPGRMKLALVVPFLKPGQEILVTIKYSWMETRFHEPLFMEGEEPTLESTITIDAPNGIKPQFMAADKGEVVDLMPESEDHAHTQWGHRNNRAGLGKRYIFKREFGINNKAKPIAKRAQIFFAFDAPSSNDKQVLFENWESVSRYLYNRIDRYDLASNAIKDFALKESAEKDDAQGKIAKIFSFLSNGVERRNSAMSMLGQEAQTATRTFARLNGSDTDIVILGKALFQEFQNLGISADIVAVSDPAKNPRLNNFYSPVLFDKVILAVFDGAQTYYFDPSKAFVRLDQVPHDLQGQNALLLRPHAGQHFTMPYEPPQNNQVAYFYDLNMNDMGMLAGSFSMDLTGARADHARSIVTSPISTLSATNLQDKILHENLALRWQKASLNEQQVNDGSISFSGIFSPRLLARSPEQGFLLPIKEIFEPALLPLINAAHQGYSSLSLIEASVTLPENYSVDRVPLNLTINQQGLTGRFLVTHEQGRLLFKGEAMVSLPMKTDTQAPLALPEQHIAIVKMAEAEASHGASTQK